MTIASYNKVKTVAVKIDSTSGNGVIPIVSNDLSEIDTDINIISVNVFVKNLKAYAQVKSLAPVNLPNFTVEDSQTEKLYKVLDIEWKSPRYQLNLLISDAPNSWHLVGAISLLNPSGYPYRIYNLQDLYTDNLAIELGENGKIGVQIVEVGSGRLKENDLVTIHGSYVIEVVKNVPATNSSQVVMQQFDPSTLPLSNTPITDNDELLIIQNSQFKRIKASSLKTYNSATTPTPEPEPEPLPTPVDTYFANVPLLLPLTANFNDVKGHTVTPNGNPQIANSSLVLDGSSFLQIDHNNDLLFVNNAFTIEAFISLSSIPANSIIAIAGKSQADKKNNSWDLVINTSDNRLRFNYYYDDEAPYYQAGYEAQFSSLSINTLYYVAVRKESNRISMSIEGNQGTEQYLNNSRVSNSTSPIFIGHLPMPNIVKFPGKINNFRITNGVARDINVIPTRPFPTR